MQKYLFPRECFTLGIVYDMHVVIFIPPVYFIDAGEVLPLIGFEKVCELLLNGDLLFVLFYFFGVVAFLHCVVHSFFCPIQIFHRIYCFFFIRPDSVNDIKWVNIVLFIHVKFDVLYCCEYIEIA